ncbi:hypothetical protein BH11PSE12_BH11PSE12_31370 [soil metagenome]
MCFFETVMKDNDTPENVVIGKNCVKKSAINQIIENNSVSIVARQVKYLRNIVEQDYRAAQHIPDHARI